MHTRGRLTLETSWSTGSQSPSRGQPQGVVRWPRIEMAALQGNGMGTGMAPETPTLLGVAMPRFGGPGLDQAFQTVAVHTGCPAAMAHMALMAGAAVAAQTAATVQLPSMEAVAHPTAGATEATAHVVAGAMAAVAVPAAVVAGPAVAVGAGVHHHLQVLVACPPRLLISKVTAVPAVREGRDVHHSLTLAQAQAAAAAAVVAVVAAVVVVAVAAGAAKGAAAGTPCCRT
mmetsp:Transcript_31509/g.61893  ORF Transcript_31509/g.61893 Transcript_31509/m.61893 type:complete len:230 (-) Transcript_31509:101-790(-)